MPIRIQIERLKVIVKDAMHNSVITFGHKLGLWIFTNFDIDNYRLQHVVQELELFLVIETTFILRYHFQQRKHALKDCFQVILSINETDFLDNLILLNLLKNHSFHAIILIILLLLIRVIIIFVIYIGSFLILVKFFILELFQILLFYRFLILFCVLDSRWDQTRCLFQERNFMLISLVKIR